MQLAAGGTAPMNLLAIWLYQLWILSAKQRREGNATGWQGIKPTTPPVIAWPLSWLQIINNCWCKWVSLLQQLLNSAAVLSHLHNVESCIKSDWLDVTDGVKFHCILMHLFFNLLYNGVNSCPCFFPSLDSFWAVIWALSLQRSGGSTERCTVVIWSAASDLCGALDQRTWRELQ